MAEPRVYSWSYEEGDVTETLERLTATLADRYTIQEELGAGGMATPGARAGCRLLNKNSIREGSGYSCRWHS